MMGRGALGTMGSGWSQGSQFPESIRMVASELDRDPLTSPGMWGRDGGGWPKLGERRKESQRPRWQLLRACTELT